MSAWPMEIKMKNSAEIVNSTSAQQYFEISQGIDKVKYPVIQYNSANRCSLSAGNKLL